MLVGTIARLLHQLLRGFLVVFDLEGRIAAPGMAGLEGAGCRHHRAGERTALEAISINAEIGAFPHTDVIPGRALDARELPGPDMRLFIGIELEAALLDLRH